MIAEKLIIPAPAVRIDTPGRVVLDLMLDHFDQHAVAVLDGERPVGIIHRPALLDRFLSMYGREIYGKKPSREIMDADPLVVDRFTRLLDLSELVVRKGKAAFTQGFIITGEGGRYLGLGSGFDLMREVTQMQIQAARYANPLTGLAGNVPIQDEIQRLLDTGEDFVIAYFDLDQFKPYNDVYGFRRGDDIIRLLAELTRAHCDETLDFIGHVGGDDFVALFRSADWEARCREILNAFDAKCLAFFDSGHVAEGGYRSEDRAGNIVFHRLVSLSIGAVRVNAASFRLHQEVARAASEAKHMAKRMPGSSLFIDQRRVPAARKPVD